MSVVFNAAVTLVSFLTTSLHWRNRWTNSANLLTWRSGNIGAGIAQWLERRTRDRKVAGSNPCRSGGSIFFSRVNFLCWLLFPYPFHPRVTAVARKRSRSFCQNAGSRLQLNTHAPYVCGFAWSDMVHGCVVYTERAEMAAVSCGTSHVSAVSTPGEYSKTRSKKLFTNVKSHASAMSLLENGQ